MCKMTLSYVASEYIRRKNAVINVGARDLLEFWL